MNLQWIAHPRVSIYHLSHLLSQRQSLSRHPSAELLAAPQRALSAALARHALDADLFYRALVPLAREEIDAAERAQRALQAMQDAERGSAASAHAPLDSPSTAAAAADLATALAQLDDHVATRHDALQRELELRRGPVAEQWEARGPGLWRALTKRLGTTSRFAASSPATLPVALVEPVHGGGGVAYELGPLVCLEAVLANPIPQLPELLRLTWLAAQLEPVESPSLAGQASPYSRALIQAALIPPVLSAGEYVELCRADEQTLATAMNAWLEPAGVTIAPQLLWEWWQRQSTPVTSWTDALDDLRHSLS